MKMEEPFAKLPLLSKTECESYYSSCDRDVCYWSNSDDVSETILINFLSKASDFGFSEDQALAILTYNAFDVKRAECDLKIYRPLKGLGHANVKNVVRMISDGIIRSLRSREHRDFDDIMIMFPGYTVGDVLQAYSQHRFLIKKQTYRAKRFLRRPVQRPSISTNIAPGVGLLPSNGGVPNNGTGNGNGCVDMQFRVAYKRHYDLIHQCSGGLDHHLLAGADQSEAVAANGQRSMGFDGLGLEDADEGGGWWSVDNEADAALLALLRKMSRRLSCRRQEQQLHKQQRWWTGEGGAGMDKSRLAGLLSIAEKEQQQQQELSGSESTEQRFVQFIKSNSRRFDVEHNPEDEVEEEVSYKLLCDRHENILNQFKEHLPEPSAFQKLSHTWSNMDVAIFLLSIGKFGKDFSRIADSILTKSEAMVRSFYLTFRDQFNLDSVAGSIPVVAMTTEPANQEPRPVAELPATIKTVTQEEPSSKSATNQNESVKPQSANNCMSAPSLAIQSLTKAATHNSPRLILPLNAVQARKQLNSEPATIKQMANQYPRIILSTSRHDPRQTGLHSPRLHPMIKQIITSSNSASRSVKPTANQEPVNFTVITNQFSLIRPLGSSIKRAPADDDSPVNRNHPVYQSINLTEALKPSTNIHARLNKPDADGGSCSHELKADLEANHELKASLEAANETVRLNEEVRVIYPLNQDVKIKLPISQELIVKKSRPANKRRSGPSRSIRPVISSAGLAVETGVSGGAVTGLVAQQLTKVSKYIPSPICPSSGESADEGEEDDEGVEQEIEAKMKREAIEMGPEDEENEDTEPEEMISFKRTLRDRSGARSERFKSIIDEEKRAKNRKFYSRRGASKRKAATQSADQDTTRTASSSSKKKRRR